VDDESPWLGLTPRGDAIVALVTGLLPSCGVGALAALFFGYRGRRRLDAAGARDGRGMATAGIVLGWLGIVAAVWVWFLVISALVTGAA
jgi:hypothetical protein